MAIEFDLPNNSLRTEAGTAPLNGSQDPINNSRALEFYNLKSLAESEDTEAHRGEGTCPRTYREGSGKTRTIVTPAR